MVICLKARGVANIVRVHWTALVAIAAVASAAAMAIAGIGTGARGDLA